MNGYFIETICPGLVRIHEESVSYPMDAITARENIETIMENRAKYASDEAYLRRLEFYQTVLEALEGKESHHG